MCGKDSKNAAALHGLELFTVQSLVCVFVLITVGVFRWIGGDVYKEMASRFRDAMLDDTLISALVNTSNTVYASPVIYANTTDDKTAVCAPLKGGVLTSSFGYRESLNGFHEGVDIAADKGTPLTALKNGVVSTVAYDENGYGHYVVITCSDTEKYLYAHCDSITVKEGERVVTGQTIATVGDTGRSTGDHLHFEWIVNDEPVDPSCILPKETYA